MRKAIVLLVLLTLAGCSRHKDVPATPPTKIWPDLMERECAAPVDQQQGGEPLMSEPGPSQAVAGSGAVANQAEAAVEASSSDPTKQAVSPPATQSGGDTRKGDWDLARSTVEPSVGALQPPVATTRASLWAVDEAGLARVSIEDPAREKPSVAPPGGEVVIPPVKSAVLVEESSGPPVVKVAAAGPAKIVCASIMQINDQFLTVDDLLRRSALPLSELPSRMRRSVARAIS